jgi:hypothetical protein
MASLISVGARLRHISIKKRNKKKEPSFVQLGFDSYKEYLESDLWQDIRTRKLSECPVCECCDKPASQVHHNSYGFMVMAGHDDESLVAVCRECHVHIEFCNGEKRSQHGARKSLLRLLHDNGKHRRAMQLKYRKKAIESLDADMKKLDFPSERKGLRKRFKSASQTRPEREKHACKRCSKMDVLRDGYCRACINAGVIYVPRVQYS